jgi:hypothetical protein
MDRIEIELGAVDWTYVAQDRDQWRGFFKQGYEPSDSFKRCEIIEWLNDCRLLKKALALWSFHVCVSRNRRR